MKKGGWEVEGKGGEKGGWEVEGEGRRSHHVRGQTRRGALGQQHARGGQGALASGRVEACNRGQQSVSVLAYSCSMG